MKSFQQLLIIIVGLFLMNFIFSKNKVTKILTKNNETEIQTTQALDLLPIPATILVSQNPNVIQTKSVELI